MHGIFDRRRFLVSVSASPWFLSATARGTGAEKATSNDPFYFIVAADPQLFWGPLELWQRTIEEANRLQPAFMVVCGDPMALIKWYLSPRHSVYAVQLALAGGSGESVGQPSPILKSSMHCK